MTKNLSILKSAEWHTLFKMLENPDISELQVNGKDSIWVKHKGKRVKIDNVQWDTDEDYMDSVRISLAESGFIRSDMPFDPKGALFEGPVAYKGSNNKEIRGRAHIVLPPAAPAPTLTFAKKTPSLTTLDAIAESGSMSMQMMRFIKAAIYARCTIVFSGSTGAGKTTTLEACTKLFPHDERVAVCEDTPELILLQDNVSYMHSLPWRPGMDPNKVATLDWIVAQVNRMRADRAIVGETRGKEFADFLVVANSGLEGSLTTLHANTPRECLQKMSMFALKGHGSNVPMKAINTDIANATDLIVQLTKKDGRYITTHIEEVSNTVGDKENAPITTQTLWKYDEEESVHNKETVMGDRLRDKFTEAGIDVREFVSMGMSGAGSEPNWLEGRGPKASAGKERQIKPDKTLGGNEETVKKKKGLGGGLPSRRSI